VIALAIYIAISFHSREKRKPLTKQRNILAKFHLHLEFQQVAKNCPSKSAYISSLSSHEEEKNCVCNCSAMRSSEIRRGSIEAVWHTVTVPAEPQVASDIRKLPSELILTICNCFDSVSVTCFGLTCKIFVECFQTCLSSSNPAPFFHHRSSCCSIRCTLLEGEFSV
jgi:hypothetical protein